VTGRGKARLIKDGVRAPMLSEQRIFWLRGHWRRLFRDGCHQRLQGKASGMTVTLLSSRRKAQHPTAVQGALQRALKEVFFAVYLCLEY
jgi:hypothetical protein